MPPPPVLEVPGPGGDILFDTIGLGTAPTDANVGAPIKPVVPLTAVETPRLSVLDKRRDETVSAMPVAVVEAPRPTKLNSAMAGIVFDEGGGPAPGPAMFAELLDGMGNAPNPGVLSKPEDATALPGAPSPATPTTPPGTTAELEENPAVAAGAPKACIVPATAVLATPSPPAPARLLGAPTPDAVPGGTAAPATLLDGRPAKVPAKPHMEGPVVVPVPPGGEGVG